jgi:predicted nuclease with TOPRIM domain
MAVLTHLTTNDLYDMDFHACRIDAKIGNFDVLDLVHTLRDLVQEVERVKDMEDFIDDLKDAIHSLQSENLELSVERDNLEDTVIELEQKLEKLEKEQDDDRNT